MIVNIYLFVVFVIFQKICLCMYLCICFLTLSIHVKLMNEMQIDKIQKNVANQQHRKKKKPEWRE